MLEIENSPSMFDGMRSIIHYITCNPSWNNENETNLVLDKKLQNRNENGGDRIRSSNTPSTDENDDEDSVILSSTRDLALHYEDGADLELDEGTKTAKTKEKQRASCSVLCFDCNEKNSRNVINYRTSKIVPPSIPNQSEQQEIRYNGKISNDTNQIKGIIMSDSTKQPNSNEKNEEIVRKKMMEKLNNAKLDTIFRKKSSACEKQEQKKQLPKNQKNHTTTNWKHVFWNNYFRNNSNNNNNSASSKITGHQKRQMQSSSTPPKFTLPFDELTIPPEFKRSDISELTMKSSHAHYHAHYQKGLTAVTTSALLDSAKKRSFVSNRVMAYYAIGQHCPKYDYGESMNKKRISNRKCYFTGKMIFSGMPFFAGTLRQGYKTLVVFCLPEAIGLPQITQQKSLSTAPTASTSLNTSFSSSHPNNTVMKKHTNRQDQLNYSAISESSSNATTAGSNAHGGRGYHDNNNPKYQKTYPNSSLRHHHSTLSGITSSNGCYSVSHDYSSANDYLSSSSYSGDDDNDYNKENPDVNNISTCSTNRGKTYPIGRYDDLLEQLPNPSNKLLQSLNETYADAYKTLPSSIQNNVESWQIYNKFCYFSGLPICPGDLHYKYSMRKTKKKNYNIGSDSGILLSHEVMEVVLGKDSADLVRLPNTAVFDYLKMNYKHQFCKLGEELIFERYAWQIVLPEI